MENNTELQEFQEATARLGNAIKHASDLWQDKNYQQLASSVARLGNQSRSVIEAANRCQRSIAEFHKIADEHC